MFTTQHYEALAKVMSKSAGWDELLEMLCLMFKEDNPSFDEDKFREACNE